MKPTKVPWRPLTRRAFVAMLGAAAAALAVRTRRRRKDPPAAGKPATMWIGHA